MTPATDGGRDDRLRRYRDKRSGASGEPAGKRARTAGGDGPRFVIQKHAARRLHYDFRLEVEGTLRSWAVPKGPSTDPREKRLAVEVEDHPLEYADFEGTIGKGNYGAGTVIVWDAGTYRNLDDSRDMAAAIEHGHAKFWLEGDKLRGGWTLQRTHGGSKPQWLLDQTPRRSGRRSPQPAEHATEIGPQRPDAGRGGGTSRQGLSPADAAVSRAGRREPDP